ncbi:MAG: RNA methyltransferase [Ignavibacteria bacterium GWF2_33_9]|nr:MAG: RNA methyltransferase [Ignavibacteria bacterium GWF2_33_9]
MRKLLYEEILAERHTVDTVKETLRHPVHVILHNIRSSYNVGSIFRTSDSALVSGMTLCGFTPHPPSKEISKTALGSLETVPWTYEKDILKAIQHEKDSGRKVFAVELTDKKKLYTDLVLADYPLTLVLGNEISGIDDAVIDACDDSLEIPMFGLKHSLNVSVAAGIVIFESVRIWNEIQK